jgi:hypothetical protein
VRTSSHRNVWRPGPQNWAARKAYHLSRLFACVRSLGELLAFERSAASPEERAARLKARMHYDAAAPYLADQEGDIWRD